MITKSFHINIAMQFTATRQIFYRSPGAKWFFALFVGLPLLYLVVAYNSDYKIDDDFLPNMPIWLFILATFGYAFIVMPLVQYYQATKQFQQDHSAHKKQAYDINATGFKQYAGDFSVEVQWKNVRAVEVTTKFLLFYVSINTAYFIPLKLMSAQELTTIKDWFSAARK